MTRCAHDTYSLSEYLRCKKSFKYFWSVWSGARAERASQVANQVFAAICAGERVVQNDTPSEKNPHTSLEKNEEKHTNVSPLLAQL